MLVAKFTVIFPFAGLSKVTVNTINPSCSYIVISSILKFATGGGGVTVGGVTVGGVTVGGVKGGGVTVGGVCLLCYLIHPKT
ncbi:hypothetical protein MASR2M54_25950 [Aliarcobacter cryaerophilus]